MSGLAAVNASSSPTPVAGGALPELVVLMQGTFGGTGTSPTNPLVTRLELAPLAFFPQDVQNGASVVDHFEIVRNTWAYSLYDSDHPAVTSNAWVLPSGTGIAELNVSNGFRFLLVQFIELASAGTVHKSLFHRALRKVVRYRRIGG